MVNNHMVWRPTDSNGKGDLYPEFWGNTNDLPSFGDVTITESVELVMIFPPRTAIKREIR